MAGFCLKSQGFGITFLRRGFELYVGWVLTIELQYGLS